MLQRGLDPIQNSYADPARRSEVGGYVAGIGIQSEFVSVSFH